MSTFEERVQRTIAQLQHDSFQSMAAVVTESRMAWLDEVLPRQEGYSSMTPRQAYEFLFFENMGLDPEDLPVVCETDREIVWLSRNRCTLLQACQELGLDTRKVCRPVNEKATQAFLSRINPRLRFHRSYVEIRPYAGHCLERIIQVDLDACMRIAIQEAIASRLEGNKGYGAVVILEDRIVGQAHDTVVTERDPSLHAGVNAIRQAVKTVGDADLCGAILFTTCEPCPMCASLAVWANLTTMVYGVSIEEAAQPGQPHIRISAGQVAQGSPWAMEVIGNVLHDECKALYL